MGVVSSWRFECGGLGKNVVNDKSSPANSQEYFPTETLNSLYFPQTVAYPYREILQVKVSLCTLKSN